tara:strand:+ start:4410 stop:4616 length:207 start_codon:yes stop_codon:yes gene_type:complete
MRAPRHIVRLDSVLKRIAFLAENPCLRRIEKSATSCGISWIMIAKAVVAPRGIDVMKAAAIVIPSTKL